jgi:phosphatidylglycerophosphatase A
MPEIIDVEPIERKPGDPEPIDLEPIDLEPIPPRGYRRRPTWNFLYEHPAHAIGLGFGSGLSWVAPGTMGTLWAWLAFALLSPHMTDPAWAWLIGLSLPIGWWACSISAKHLNKPDPSNVVWDEIVAFWLVLWLVTPASFSQQFWAFVLFRYFDAAKPGPVGWADRLFHGINPDTDRRAWFKAGLGIMLDDLVAAGCTLLVIAIWHFKL